MTAMAACTVIVVSASTSAFADTYRWTDANGNVGFADSLQKVPPQYRESARKSSAGPPSKTFQTVPSDPGLASPPPVNSEELYAVWRDRMNRSRGDLEQLKIQREAAQKEYDTLRAEIHRNPVQYFGDPETEVKYRSKLAELDDELSKKEYELTTTIPDEARRAGIPPGVLNQ